MSGVSIGLYLNADVNGSFASRLEVIFLLAYNNAFGLAIAACSVVVLFLVAKYAFQKIDFRNWRQVLLLIIATILAAALTFENLAGPNATTYFSTLQNQLSKNIALASTSDGSTSIRLRMLQQGLNELEGYLLMGRGVYLEPYITQEIFGSHKHLHNNYISWLIWGGVFILASGLIFLISPVVLIAKQGGLRYMVFPLMISSLWLVSLLFDSFFAWNGFTYTYIVLICMAYQAIRSKYV